MSRLVLAGVALAALIQGLAAQSRYPVVREATISRTLRVDQRAKRLLEVSTISGNVRIAGVAGDAIDVAVKKTIRASIEALGGEMEDVVRTRVYLRDHNDWEEVSKAHGRVFGDIRPANTLLEVSALVGNYAVEIDAEAIVQQ